ncbi:SUMF1/EgtB/PvdO family nonheme iron enzyme [Aquibium sp. LZ166]|uniref:SUMF1/EgtB/PvdO family nonheme iron enzyme n=1 Tax=Aquibium pacificus TaxID=3153579 RepID=A0ABV3SSZ3_9HYPH
MHLTLLEAALGAAAAIAVPLTAAGIMAGSPVDPAMQPAATVVVGATTLDFPLPGEFLAVGTPAVAPVERAAVGAFQIMKRQVSLADYRRCVDEAACAAPDARMVQADVPVTGVNWLDAQSYAQWYSKATRLTWRLPTAIEAAAAAAERFSGDAFSAAADDPANPAVRWIRRYREEAAAKRPPDPKPKPAGYYGANSKGVEDFAGNVWEWTSTCYARTILGEDRDVVDSTENCGVRVMEGRHRAYMSTFVRDGKSGGCAVGTPPENLGFRLVLEDRSAVAAAAARLRNLVDTIGTKIAQENGK